MTRQTRTALLAAAAVLAICAGASADAATLNTPEGMAVDPAGNLYVANQTGNNVTIYTNTYALKGRITAGLNSPTSVAVGASGQIFVANYWGGNVTSYSASLVQGTTLTDAADAHPAGVLSDALGDLWVLDSTGTARAYLDNGTPIGSYGLSGSTAFNLWQGNIVLWGSPSGHSGETGILFANAGEVVHGGPGVSGGGVAPLARVGGAAVDGVGQQYISDDYNGFVAISDPSMSYYIAAIKPSFTPYGIAVDQLHGRIFVSGGPFANTVAVYSLKSPHTLIHTIE